MRNVDLDAEAPLEKLAVVQEEKIRALAEEVMGAAFVEGWLVTPILALGHKKPIDVMRTKEGAQLVLDTLHRVQHGVYS